IYWVQETTIMLAGWITFLAIGVLYKRKEYIRIEYFVSFLNPTAQLALSFVIHLASLWALFIVVVYGVVLFEFQIGMKNETLQIADNFFYTPVIIGGISLFVTILYHFLETMQELRRAFSLRRGGAAL
ncbi:hypothetical protein LCGC14_0505110, partial [marine sediment metagenome]